MPCSAVTGANLVEGLDWTVSDVAGRLYYSTTILPPAGAAIEPERPVPV
jgi:hypothetical protein